MSLDFDPFPADKMALRCSALAGLYRGNGDAVPLERSGGVRPSLIALSRGGTKMALRCSALAGKCRYDLESGRHLFMNDQVRRYTTLARVLLKLVQAHQAQAENAVSRHGAVCHQVGKRFLPHISHRQ